MDLTVWAWVLIGIGSALFTALTWFPVGGLSVRLMNSAFLEKLLSRPNSRMPDRLEKEYVWFGYFFITLLALGIVEISLRFLWTILVFTYKLGEKLTGDKQ